MEIVAAVMMSLLICQICTWVSINLGELHWGDQVVSCRNQALLEMEAGAGNDYVNLAPLLAA